MCAVSMITDHYRDKWMDPAPNTWPGVPWGPIPVVHPSQLEFDNLKKEVEELKALLKKAKKYDEDNGEPHCEMEEKVAFLRKMAGLVGVDFEDIFPR